tara:strand:- start:1270 stop:1845 length:576 start_codon:yes stop_codon:yes gene_type:complete
MVIKKSSLYFVIDRPEEINLDYVKNIGSILILRKPEDSTLHKLEKFQKGCFKRGIDLYVANNVKFLFKLKTNKFYISAHNKNQFANLKRTNPKIDIIGSAHNACEINEKIKQGCKKILLSRLFKTNYKKKKGCLGTVRFNLLTQRSSMDFIALGGINEKNYKKIKILNVIGFAMSSDKKKAGNYLPAFYKN